MGADFVALFGEGVLGPEAPGDQIAGVESDAEKIGGNEAELSGANADNADDGAIDGGDHPALPQLPAEKNCAENGENARDVIQTNAVE